MGATNNSLIRTSDVVRAGGVKNTSSLKIVNELIKDKDITKGTDEINGPLFYNVTLKNEYGDTHLTKFQDLDIAQTYPITLKVKIPNGMTGYTLHGFTAKVTYPNNLVKSHSIDITETTADKNIEIKNCCDNAKVKVSVSSFRSGATISTTAKTVNADVAINSLFTEDDGLICAGSNSYSCFTLTQGLTPGGPVVTGDTNAGQIVISINTTNLSSDKLFIEEAKYATGATPLEAQDPSSLTWTTISELSFKEFSGLTASSSAIQATISVPVRAYVAIYLSDPVDKNIVNPTTYKWKEGNYQYVQSSLLSKSVTYTVIPSGS